MDNMENLAWKRETGWRRIQRRQNLLSNKRAKNEATNTIPWQDGCLRSKNPVWAETKGNFMSCSFRRRGESVWHWTFFSPLKKSWHISCSGLWLTLLYWENGPGALDVEWAVSAPPEEYCKRVKHLLFWINASVAASVAFCHLIAMPTQVFQAPVHQ